MITEIQAKKVLTTVDAGLIRGLGKPILGKMCIEAAIAYALGSPIHTVEHECVGKSWPARPRE